jgi:hypothetical protein
VTLLPTTGVSVPEEDGPDASTLLVTASPPHPITTAAKAKIRYAYGLPINAALMFLTIPISFAGRSISHGA